ncbi:MAG: adenylate/guanylate cyclase domain-containing protein [Microcoleaceae cyanobacterium]
MKPEKINPKKFEHYSKQELANYIEKLEQELEEAHQENNDLELLLDTITETTTELENEIHTRNKEMFKYIEQVKEVTRAAEAVENDTFEANCLDEVAARVDSLGILARVFQHMVSTLKSREKQLADAKEQLEAVLNAVPGMISWISIDGLYIGVNQHLAETLNLSPDSFFGKKLNFLQNSPEFSQFIDQFIQSSQSYYSQEIPISIKGDRRYYLMAAQKYNRGQALVSVGIDVTERRKAIKDLELERNAFARFVPSEYLRFFGRENIVNIKLGDHVIREASILFSDIRSFTSIAETMTPQEIFDFINSYLGSVSPVIRNYNGFILKYIGDGIMAAFPNRANDALNAGIAHIGRVKEYNRENKKAGNPAIKIGIGIHIGHIMVGIVGESQRFQADALSDSVNLTARLESLTKIYGVSILISDSVFNKLENPTNYNIRFIDRATVKGRKGAIDLYEVLDGEEEKIIDLKLKTQKQFALALQLYVQGKWSLAQHYFQQVLNINEADRTALLYLKRIDKLKTQIDPQNWDGVWHFNEK